MAFHTSVRGFYSQAKKNRTWIFVGLRGGWGSALGGKTYARAGFDVKEVDVRKLRLLFRVFTVLLTHWMGEMFYAWGLIKELFKNLNYICLQDF